MRKSRPGPLTPGDWARTALAAIARGGIAAVAVESVAADLGATKGSFYWHFKNRDALIQAALDMWEQSRTESVIEELEQEPDPAERLRKLLEAAFERSPADRAEIALLANPEHPAATAAVRRVAKRRIGYIAQQLEELGWDQGEALDRSVVLYYIYAGYLQMAHVAPDATGDDARRRHVRLILAALVAGPPAVPAMYRGTEGRPGPVLFTLDVNGERFAIRRSGDGGTAYDWLSGPNKGYGFGSSAAPNLSVAEHRKSIRVFLAMIDPKTGYIGDD